MAESRTTLDTLPQNLTLGNVINAALALDGPDHASAMRSNSHALRSQIMQSQTLDLRRESTFDYFTLYIQHICTRFPFLSAETARKQYDNIVDAERSTTSNSRPPRQAAPSLEYFETCLGVAMGILLSPESMSLASLVTLLHSTAAKMLTSLFAKHDVLLDIRCMLSLAILSMLSPSGGSAWHLIGLILQKCISAGLEKEPDSATHITPAVADERKRLFWSAYVLDRAVSLSLGRPFGIQDEDVNVSSLPDAPGDRTPIEMAFQGHLVTQARLASRIQQASRQDVMFHYHNVGFWRELPTVLRHLPSGSQHLSDHLEQLGCRMLIQLAKPYLDSSSGPDGVPDELTLDIVAMSKRFIDHCYERMDQAHVRSSFVDALDIVSAGLAFAYFVEHRYLRDGRAALVNETLQKCSLLVAVGGGGRFSASKTLQAVVIALCGRLMRYGHGNGGDNQGHSSSSTTLVSRHLFY
jgi:hypothetical protein